MIHNHIGWCFACNSHTCQEDRDVYYTDYTPIMKSLRNIKFNNIETPTIKPLFDLNIYKRTEEECTCIAGYNILCPKHGINRK
jgi:hypothetical protein